MNNKLFDSIIKAKGVGQIISKKLNEKTYTLKLICFCDCQLAR